MEIRDIVNKPIGFFHAPDAAKPAIEKVEEHAPEAPPGDKPDEKPAEKAEEKPVEKAASKAPKDGVVDVLLTSFVIQ